jgi:hypothetical protein
MRLSPLAPVTLIEGPITLLPLAVSQAIITLTRPTLLLAVVVIPHATLFPLGQGSVVGEVVFVLVHVGAHGP